MLTKHMTTTQTTATDALAEMFERKYAELRANGATDEQAISLLRGLWLEAIGVSK